VRLIFPADPATPQVGPDDVAALAKLYAYPAAAPGGAPWLRANMVESVDGAGSLDGRSGGLSGDADRQVFRVLRGLADVIVAGAQTARTEKYRPVREQEIWPALRQGRPPTPPIAVVTRTLDLDLNGPLLTGAADGARTILLTTEAAPADRRAAASVGADVVVLGTDVVPPAAMVDALAARGYRNVLVEGGPTLLRQIVDDGLLDELCLTISPLLEGHDAGRILAFPAPFMTPGPAHGAVARLSLAHVLEDQGALLCRYLLDPPGGRTGPPVDRSGK
jgi:riboflavin biosynthesis pyrimidine reductase